MEDFLKELNGPQREAVEYGVGEKGEAGGPLLIIAGAGSGKTNTLAYRVAHLIRKGADPRRLLLLTFTRRASDEMIKRAQRLLIRVRADSDKDKAPVKEPGRIAWAGTFHSVGNRLLRLYSEPIGLDPSFTVMDRSDSEDLLNKVRNDLGYAAKEKRFPKKGTCFAVYSHAVNSQQPVEKSLASDFPWCQDWAGDLKKIFHRYAEEKQKQNVLDYDDLLLYWYHMMGVPQIAETVGKKFDHVMVDEYQDTNLLQAQILLRLRPDGRGVAVVGDDAQSIYSFRAATVRNILDFPAQYAPSARVITLEQNYRSTQTILRCSNAVIEQAKDRYTKNLRSDRVSAEKPFYVSAEDESFQVDYVVKKVLEYREAGLKLVKQAVLFRASHHSAELEVELARRNIPFIKYGGLKFLEAAHVKDTVCVLRCAENPRDSVALFRVLQIIEGVGPGAAARAIAFLEEKKWDLNALEGFRVPPAAQTSWPGLCKLLVTLRNKGAEWQGQLRMVRQWYTRHLFRMYDTPDLREKDEAQLELMASNFKSRENFLTELTLDPPDTTSDQAGDPLLDEDYLVLSTIHSAKGREWNAVFVLNVADGWIPSDMATNNPEQIEEERRLLYVAMTRARDHLHLLQPMRYYSQSYKQRHADSHMYSTPSRFIVKGVEANMEKVFHGRSQSEREALEEMTCGRVDVATRVRSMWV